MATIVAIAGSPSHPSRTYSLLDQATQYLSRHDISTAIISVRDFPAEDLVFGRYDSPALNPAKDLIAEATGLIIATPVYKASYTGVLKAFLDLLPQKALVDKVVLPIATGGTIAHLLAIDYGLKPVLSELGARHFINSIYAVDKQIQRQEDGGIQLDEELEQRLHGALNDLIVTVSQSQAVPPSLAIAS